MRTSDRVELRTGKQGQAGLVWERRIPARVLSHWPRSFISSASILSPPCAISCATDRLTCALDWTKTRLLPEKLLEQMAGRQAGRQAPCHLGFCSNPSMSIPQAASLNTPLTIQ
ncbi:hypothetical protein AcV5_004826 [Taiwanofungus camphoratus]|nr:hypothetical protein AcW2_000578 [Antrodia cinnamomea]KAI0936775.1 hypothetical protein AcV5_004826 [Antrodia cinnamomea]KAI0961996.1 hypothetical protein AcV7_000941 [Antrodia cinnamomea]